MTHTEALLDSWQKKELNPKDKLRLLRLLEGTEGKGEFEKIWQHTWASHAREVPAQREVLEKLEALRLEIRQQIDRDKNARLKKRNRGLMAIAASAALLLMGGWLLWQSMQGGASRAGLMAHAHLVEEVVEKGGKIKRVALPDGSFVWLNVDSKLFYPESFGDSTRWVHLEGEAYFDVAEDPAHPFVVALDNLETRVLGTTFYISCYPDAPERITLETGKIQVKDESGAQVTLLPNQQLIASPNEPDWKIETVEATKMGAWKEGMLNYAHIPLQELVPALERWYGVRIQLQSQAAQKCAIVGKPTNKSIEDLLESFETISGITYTVDAEGVIHIHGGNCP